MTTVRAPAVAGSFYERDRRDLATTVDRLLDDASPPPGAPPAALIQPHAGYVYSGPVAAIGYRRLRETVPSWHCVVVLGPAHTVALDSIAVTGADAWDTPLGRVEVDGDLRATLADASMAVEDDTPHRREHSIEVQLPFLQRVLEPSWTLVPLVVGTCTTEAVTAVVDACAGAGALVIVSTDLSHYLPQAEAQGRDARTVASIVAGDHRAIGPSDACGCYPLRGLLASRTVATLPVEVLDVRTSADTAGSPDSVVGYTSIAYLRGSDR